MVSSSLGTALRKSCSFLRRLHQRKGPPTSAAFRHDFVLRHVGSHQKIARGVTAFRSSGTRAYIRTARADPHFFARQHTGAGTQNLSVSNLYSITPYVDYTYAGHYIDLTGY